MHYSHKKSSQNTRAAKKKMVTAFKADPTKTNPEDPEVMKAVFEEKMGDQMKHWKKDWFLSSWLTFLLVK